MSWWKRKPLADELRPLKPMPPPKPIELPPYSGEDACCVKCRGDEVSYEYRPKQYGELHDGDYSCTYIAVTEHIRRTCDVCGYSWRELCADADQAAT